MGSGTRDVGTQKWTPDLSILYSFNCYCTLICTLLVTKLCINLLVRLNLFYGKYTEAAITMCYKFQRIISSSLNFSEKLGKKLWRLPIYLVKLKILSLRLHKCTHFWLILRCLLNDSDYLFWWLLRKHINSEQCLYQWVSFDNKLYI